MLYLVESQPANVRMLHTSGLALDECWYELNREFRTQVLSGEESYANACDADVQFLSDFSYRRVQKSLTWFELATREFPKPAVSFVRRSLTNQVPVTALDNRRQDSQGFSMW